MGRRHRLLFALIFICACLHISIFEVIAQQQSGNLDPIKTPIDIQFTQQMSRARKDFTWSQTYFESYQRTHEVPYLKLAAEFCLKALNRIADTQRKLSRTTKFYNQADKKRLQACQFYEKIQRQSFLLERIDHLGGAGNACQQ